MSATMTNAVHLLSYEEALELPEDKLSEIVNGEIREMPPPNNSHYYLIEELADRLRAQIDRAQFKVGISAYGQGIRRKPAFTYRSPDLAVHQKKNLARGPFIWAVPDFIAECLSPSNRKGSVELLLHDYAEIGAPEVWLIYPEDRKIVRWNFVERFHDDIIGGTLAPFRFPEAQVPLQALWDAWDGKL